MNSINDHLDSDVLINKSFIYAAIATSLLWLMKFTISETNIGDFIFGYTCCLLFILNALKKWIDPVIEAVITAQRVKKLNSIGLTPEEYIASLPSYDFAAIQDARRKLGLA